MHVIHGLWATRNSIVRSSLGMALWLVAVSCAVCQSAAADDETFSLSCVRLSCSVWSAPPPKLTLMLARGGRCKSSTVRRTTYELPFTKQLSAWTRHLSNFLSMRSPYDCGSTHGKGGLLEGARSSSASCAQSRIHPPISDRLEVSRDTSCENHLPLLSNLSEVVSRGRRREISRIGQTRSP